MKMLNNHVNIAAKRLIRLPMREDGTYLFAGVVIRDHFDCSNNKLTSLSGSPIKTESFYCHDNELTSLVGGPQETHSFDCSGNQLKDLRGAPAIVNGYFDCSTNQLESLEGCPKEVNGDFYIYHNKKKFSANDVKAVCNVRGFIMT